MTLKELENKLKECQQELENLKKNSLKYGDLKVGDTFIVDDLEYTKIDDSRCILNTYKDIDCVFDCYNNDYSQSLIRHFVNNRFCALMRIDKFKLECLDVSGDKLTLLSKEEYEACRKVIKNFKWSWWLRSPIAGVGSRAWCVDDDGDVFSDYVSDDYGVRAVLKFKSATPVVLVN